MLERKQGHIVNMSSDAGRMVCQISHIYIGIVISHYNKIILQASDLVIVRIVMYKYRNFLLPRHGR